jgi:hypothetical protein
MVDEATVSRFCVNLAKPDGVRKCKKSAISHFDVFAENSEIRQRTKIREILQFPSYFRKSNGYVNRCPPSNNARLANDLRHNHRRG